eukprot:TRINITY_DN2569_c0_g1_i3.p1 TRINITY_DN2569_c0_g1~~TRINITY_DN2569_c0_g1_i3.p1  ORF type:complete len:455 (-),score=52.60 TRINITY_DN2569_c0_g1_i3:15-1379(-)
MLPKGWSYNTQVLIWVFSFDGVHDPEDAAITVAAAALLLSDIPLTRAVAGVHIGAIEGKGLVVNPSVKVMDESKLDLMLAGSSDSLLMIEGYCDFFTEEQMLEALKKGYTIVSQQCKQLEEWAQSVGKEKRQDLLKTPEELYSLIPNQLGEELSTALYVTQKQERGRRISELGNKLKQKLLPEEQSQGFSENQLMAAYSDIQSMLMRERIIDSGVRPDGRELSDIRPITCSCGILPRAHGSAIFTRGETQALSSTTLGQSSSAQRAETLASSADEDLQHFYLQYYFPPCSVGEVGRVGIAGRREIGHGYLAQRALLPTVPDREIYPYTIRVESTITESNGSSSMASVCAGCLAMMDAGVPIKQPVAGVAMGLILKDDKNFVILSDILGLEDHLGDMDFKVAGDSERITAFQMDVKVQGITIEIMREYCYGKRCQSKLQPVYERLFWLSFKQMLF